MISALNRYPAGKRRSEVAKAWAARSVEARAKKRMERGPDADTLRKRAAHDARGKVLREGVTFRGDAPSDFWQVVRSRKGRVSQCDCLLNGQLVKTCSLKLAAKWVASL